MGLKVTRPYRNVCGFESKSVPTHGVIENIEVRLKEFPEKIVYIDIIVVDVPDVWGMLLSRKFGAMIGGSLEMDLTFLRLPLKDGTTGRLLNVSLTGTHVHDVAPAKNELQKDVIQTLHDYRNNIGDVTPLFSLLDLKRCDICHLFGKSLSS